jgi:hypothetical protein
MDSEFVWVRRGEKVPERERHTVQSAKFMLTIVWNPGGFHLIKVLEKCRKFNTGYYIAEYESYCPNGAQLNQRAPNENCWCMRTMRARIPPSYQLNIGTRIE